MFYFKCEYDANPRRYTGRNGKEICSRSYNSNILSEAFGNSTISSNSYGYSKKFSEILGKRFERVCKEMEDDIDKGIRNRDYILDILNTDGNAFTRPWFGQLMTGPQLMAYLCQVNMWLEIYKPRIEI